MRATVQSQCFCKARGRGARHEEELVVERTSVLNERHGVVVEGVGVRLLAVHAVVEGRESDCGEKGTIAGKRPSLVDRRALLEGPQTKLRPTARSSRRVVTSAAKLAPPPVGPSACDDAIGTDERTTRGRARLPPATVLGVGTTHQ